MPREIAVKCYGRPVECDLWQVPRGGLRMGRSWEDPGDSQTELRSKGSEDFPPVSPEGHWV